MPEPRKPASSASTAAVIAAGGVDHAVGPRGFARQQCGVVKRALHGNDATRGQLFGLHRIADQAAHAMSGSDEVSGDRAADKTGRAGNEELHGMGLKAGCEPRRIGSGP
ncbi:hypothetical protein OR16_38494 [Cupriavidus basilensis OR16]|uniref:Uncharacterized protein n=1 Tax=Cupriavidus basilensis OR16 TaxID=1127483 RepID=H1SH05_9BURK|nr:hypothetical protein OR16_38494 [Cupriavidus basilensis OR16]